MADEPIAVALLITLHDLLARPPSLDWFEAVAIVQAVCAEALRIADGDSPTIPARQAVLFTPDGGVEFAARGGSSQAPVIVAATLLNELLPPNRTPAQLRSFATATLEPPTRYASLEEFSGALAYFDRPGREKVLRDLFERAEVAAETEIFQPLEALGLDEFPSEILEPLPRTLSPLGTRAAGAFAVDEGNAESASPPPVLVSHLPPAANEPLTTQEKSVAAATGPLIEPEHGAGWSSPSWQSRKTAVVAASGFLLLVIGVAFGRAWQTPATVERALPPPPPPPQIIAAAAAPVWAPMPSPVVPSEREALVPPATGPSSLEPSKQASPTAAAGRRPNPETASPPAYVAPRVEVAVPPRRPEAVARVVGEVPASRAAAPNASQGRRDALDELLYTDDRPKPRAADPARAIYSAEDTSVQPPVGIRQRYWTEPPPGIPAQSLTRIEILVSEKGEVESTRIVGGPRTYFDGLTLAAVKGWTFKPAIRDGRPVAYRQQVWLAIAER